MKRTLLLLAALPFFVLAALNGNAASNYDGDNLSLPTKHDQQIKVAKSDSNSEFSCGGKRACRDMDSCDEAYFHLEQCGMKKLDRDHDGIPCESICGNE